MDFVTKVNSKYEVIIPKKLRDEQGLIPGSKVIVSYNNQKLTIRSTTPGSKRILIKLRE